MCLFIYVYVSSLDLHSFPTRRSSDLQRVLQQGSDPRRGVSRARLVVGDRGRRRGIDRRLHRPGLCPHVPRGGGRHGGGKGDRKSTRLNSSHRCISYAVFCLKKKNKTK